jgi:predicted MFS family arabinose efflux permease
MVAGLIFLAAAYVLSQFYRAFLAVLAPVLGTAIGAGPEDLAVSSGLWFLSFALMQIPVGAALDRIGPRRTASVLLGLGGAGGALCFALAQGPWTIHLAMILIGAGCAPVLMAAYYIFARVYPPAVFGTLAGSTIGVGSLGNIAGAAPLAWVVAALGWRETLIVLAGVTLLVALALAAFVRDPARAAAADGRPGSLAGLLSIRALWLVLPLMAVAYAPAAVIRGLWAGPYLHEVFGADPGGIGRATLVMGLAMVAGNFAYGPLDRLVGSRKWGVFAGGAGAALALLALVLWPDAGMARATLLLAALGFLGSSYPAIMAHGCSFLPAHLAGRGVSFINMVGIGGAGILQFASRPVYRSAAEGGDPAAVFSTVFALFLVPLVLGLAAYAFSRDVRS